MKPGDRVLVHTTRWRRHVKLGGQIVGESRDGSCWLVRCDLLKRPILFNKAFVRPNREETPCPTPTAPTAKAPA